jgi:type I restriction enzyme S subunit
MSSNRWETVTLGEVADVQTGPFGSQLHQKDYVSVGTPIITVEHLGENHLIHEDLPRVADTDKQRLSKYTLKEGDIVFSRVGSVDRRALVKKEEEGWLFSGRCLRVRPTSDKLNSKFLSYYFGLDNFKKYIRAIAVGSTMPSLNTTILSEIEIPFPPIPTQRRIADILSALDNKIELNRQTNATFEAIAQSIFREWFVEFNFPNATGEIVESELGLIPSRWMVGTLGDILEVKGGTTPSTKEENFWNGEYYFATPKDLSNLTSPILLNTERKITKEGISQISSGILPAGTLLLSSRAPIGYLAISNIPVSINQGFIAINAKKTSNLFALHWLKENMETVISRANGSTFLEITKTNFKEIEIVIPDPETTKRFDEIVSPIFEQIKNNEQQSATLASIRDALLPKLMSGEIEV